MTTVLETLRGARAALAASGIGSADLDAALILSHVMSVPRHRLRTESDVVLSRAQRESFDRLVAERVRRRPLAQILGRKEFRSLEFEVTADVLSPRPETEDLVEAACAVCDRAAAAGRVPIIVDVGTGSGCIAISIAVERPFVRVHAVDLSGAALEVARRNVAWHCVGDRVTLHRGDLLAPIAALVSPASIDAVVANPPYAERSEAGSCDPEVLWEPAAAVFCEGPPAPLYARIAADAAPLVREGGELLLELPGATSGPVVDAVRTVPGWRDLVVMPDLAGLPRVLRAARG
ncbi:MAG: peptide chain release factor N(5)-glutamine methyltransferase [Planctomycetes bacterium]|nr:peptide chain release factor N(5)-glutamine methyltransferase [Planctomycetota bacterium]